VFAIVAFGYLAVRFKFYPASGVKGLIAFVNNFATPFLLFRAMLSIDFERTFSIFIIGPFFFAALIVFALGIFIARAGFKKPPGVAVISGFSAMFTNTVLLGIPIIQRAFGADAMPIIFSIIGVHAAILMTISILAMELFRRDGIHIIAALWLALKHIVTNPLLIGIGFGLVGNIANITLVDPVNDFTQIMMQAVVPVALFGLGGALNEYRMANNWHQALSMSLLKIIVHPLIVWVIMIPLLNIDMQIARYVIVLAAMPTGINAFIFATYYKRSEDLAANTILISTLLSIFSVSLWLFILSA
jgi:predicted permease